MNIVETSAMSACKIHYLFPVSRDIACRRQRKEKIIVKKGKFSWSNNIASTQTIITCSLIRSKCVLCGMPKKFKQGVLVIRGKIRVKNYEILVFTLLR